MNVISLIAARVRALNLCTHLIMSKNNDKVFYAVAKGRKIGVYETWKDCKEQVDGFVNAKYRKFFSLSEAEEFVDFWKNYASPRRDSSDSTNSVSNYKNDESFFNGKKKNNDFKYKKRGLSQPPECKNFPSISKKVFGIKENTKNGFKNPEFLVSPYTSPISSLSNADIYLNSNKRERFKRNRDDYYQKEINHDSSRKDCTAVQTFSNRLNRNSKPTFEQNLTVNKINTPNTSFQFAVPIQSLNSQNFCPNSPSSSQSSSNLFFSNNSCEISPIIFPRSDTGSENVLNAKPNVNIVKKEVITIDCQEENETLQVDDESSEVNDKLTSCLNMLESVLKVISKQNASGSKRVKNSLKLFLERMISDTNISVNPQMGAEENASKTVQESANNDKESSAELLKTEPSMQSQEVHQPRNFRFETQQQPQQQQPQVSQPQQQLHPQQESPYKCSLSPSSHLSTSFEQKNVDVLALNLRLDAFEKRFDACLKEVGGIASEISNIKTQIKEIKDSMGSGSGGGYNSGYSPRKSKGGMTQTTLNFGSGYSKSSSDFQSPSRPYSSKKDETDSEEPEAKRGRSLKRKLSRSNSGGDSKRSLDDDILSRIKMETVDYTSFVVDDDEYVEVYTDGACHSNGKNDAKAGIGIWFGDNHPLNVAEPIVGSPTNNSAEIQAARVAIELAVNAGLSKLKICTDSEFLINCVTKWMHRWKKNGWKVVNGGPVKNRKELEKLDKVASKISIRWEKVEAHTGIHGNEMADRLANEGASKYKR